MGSNSKALAEEVKIEELDENGENGTNSELEEFKTYIMKTISDMIDQRVKDATDTMWQRLQNVEAQVEINTKTGAGNLAIVKNHVHVNQ